MTNPNTVLLKQISKVIKRSGLTPTINEPENTVTFEKDKPNHSTDKMWITVNEDKNFTFSIKNTKYQKQIDRLNKTFHDIERSLDLRIN